MATRTISTRVAIEGESQYRQSVSNINSSLGALKAELGAVKAEFGKNANSMDALKAKGEMLNKLHEEHAAKVKAVAAGLENAVKVQAEYAAKVATAQNNVTAAERALAGMSGAVGASEEAQQALNAELEKYRKELADVERYNEAAQRGVNGWKKDLINAEKAMSSNNAEIHKNSQYLSEAKQSADGCATSIDQYGKRVKAAGNETERLSQKTKTMSDHIKTAGESLDKMGNKLTMGLTVPLVAAGTAAVNFSSDTVESIGKVEVAFGYAAEGVKTWSDSTLTSIGLAKGTALDMAALYGDMATSMGFAQATAADMSKTLVGLGADLASYKNISIDVANTGLKAIFTGETESLKGLGVVMTQANLQAYAMAQGFKTAYKDMDQTQQVAVRYQYVLEKTKNAQGDFARTSDNTANQLRIFQESLKEAAALAGDQLLPIITPIVGKLSELVQTFGELDDGTRKAVVQAGLFLALLGPTLKLTGGLATAVRTGVATYQALTTATTAATGAQTALNAAQAASPIGLVITAAGLLAGALLSLGVTAALTAEKTDSLTESVEKNREAHQEAVESIESYRSNTLGLMQALDEAMAVENKSAAQKAVIKGLVDQLNEAVPDLALAYNAESDSLNMTSDALERYIEVEARRQMQQENVDRLIQLEKERIGLIQAEEEAQRSLAAAEAERDQALQSYDGTATSQMAFDEAAIKAQQAEERIATLTEQIRLNAEDTAKLKDAYNQAAPAVGGLGEKLKEAGQTAEEKAKRLKELTDATKTLVSNTETLSAAFAEQAEHGSLSLDTTLKLIDAGYGAALAVDEETGSVRLNAEAYATLARAKIDEQISGLEDSRREKLSDALLAQGKAATAAATGHFALALAYQEESGALQGEMVSTTAAIAQLTALRNSLGTVVTGNWSSKAPTSSKGSSKKTQTTENHKQDGYKAAVEELDFRHDMGEISEAEYYARLEALRDQHLTKDSDAWRGATVKLHQYREKTQKEADDAAAEARKIAYETELADLKYFKDLSLISEQRYYADLARLRDKHLEEDSEEWRRVTVELHQWQHKQREESLKAEKEAYEAAQKQRADLVKQYTEQRIAAIKAEQKAEEERLNALIEGIDEEIAARKRLRQVESDDDAIAKAQKTLDAAKAQLSFARDETSRRELEKEVLRAQQALDSALQSKADNDFYHLKNQEKDALRDQLDAARDKYQGQIDNAPAWAEQRVAAEEAAAERRRKEDAAAAQRSEQERAAMESLQKMAAGALAAAGNVVNQVTNAITKVTNNNKVSITTGGSMLTSGQLARAAEKAIEKLAK